MQGQDQQGRVTRVRATGEGRANPEPPARSAGQMELLVVGGWRLAGSRGEPALGPGVSGAAGAPERSAGCCPEVGTGE